MSRLYTLLSTEIGKLPVNLHLKAIKFASLQTQTILSAWTRTRQGPFRMSKFDGCSHKLPSKSSLATIATQLRFVPSYNSRLLVTTTLSSWILLFLRTPFTYQHLRQNESHRAQITHCHKGAANSLRESNFLRYKYR